MKSQLFLLKANTFIHAYFTLSSIFAVIFLSLGIHNSFIDIGAILTFFSFLFFKRCILIDWHKYVEKGFDDELPYSAKDSFTRDMLKNIADTIFGEEINTSLIKDPTIKKKIQDSRMDVLVNIEPFIEEIEPHVIQDMFNRKIQYIAGNLILGVCLMSKYNFKTFPIFMILWVMNTFPL